MTYSGRVSEAFAYAMVLHGEQKRKGTDVPYITHLMGVASLVGEQGGDEYLVVAALLHDAVEDQGGKKTLCTIRKRFGDRVARVVEACSDSDVVPKPPWRKRKQSYIDHLDTVDADVRLVSAADKVHNARAIAADLRQIGDDLWSRFKATKEENLWYYRTLADTFLRLDPDAAIVRELDLVVREIEELASP